MIKLIEMKYNLENIDFYKKLYNDAFPKEERWSFDMILENKDNNNYKLYAVLDDNMPIGLTMIWNLDDFNFGEYLAIDKKLRGKKYGSEVLIKILDMLKDKLIVIEVEPYELNEIAKKRIEWYKRFGFILADYEYDMPSLDENNKISSIKMKIMTSRKLKNKEEHDNITKTLYETIYKPRLDEIDKWK
ncbi:GNAT family N-acetyltransferase [Brachyspira innocens]|uniref:GNAT family N-acetyltransferase n=1 Tax=Brachyspira innocens TaxID=13264 RepID=A0ABT8YXP4_9SPIR|nr:GNAT family N-acetyltransferase [Brachyspira innocens]MDO6993106.1 GNAT family N-acetyltransferase [Brachyspira innocens]MDO7020646.1 GNAT family N-acetyltransferase [Brachyspira innocens]